MTVTSTNHLLEQDSVGALAARVLRAACLFGLLMMWAVDANASGEAAPIPQTKGTAMETPAGAAPARDGNIAIQEEFDAATLANSFAAWELFIRRHPEHALVGLAWRQLRVIQCNCNEN